LRIAADQRTLSADEVDLVLLGRWAALLEQPTGSQDVDRKIGGAQDEACL